MASSVSTNYSYNVWKKPLLFHDIGPALYVSNILTPSTNVKGRNGRPSSLQFYLISYSKSRGEWNKFIKLCVKYKQGIFWNIFNNL